LNTDKPIESGYFPNDTILLNGLYVERIEFMIDSQVKGLKGRTELLAEIENIKKAGQNVPELSHKLINHYGRLLYLAMVFKYAQIHKLIPPRSESDIRRYMEHASLFEPQEGRTVCPPPKGCSPQAYARPFEELLDYLKQEKLRQNAIWRERIDAARRATPARNVRGEGSENEPTSAPSVAPKLTPGAQFLQMMGLKKGNSK
jgi:hypothetical protein